MHTEDHYLLRAMKHNQHLVRAMMVAYTPFHADGLKRQKDFAVTAAWALTDPTASTDDTYRTVRKAFTDDMCELFGDHGTLTDTFLIAIMRLADCLDANPDEYALDLSAYADAVLEHDTATP